MKVRRISISKQIIIILAFFLLLGDILTGIVLYNNMQSLIIDEVRKNATDFAGCASSLLDSSEFSDIINNNESKCYDSVLETLSTFLANSSLQYVYTFALDENKTPYFVVDSDPEDPSPFGAPYEEMTDGMIKAFEGEISADNEPSSDEWGTYISAYSPIIYNDEVIGIVGVDVEYSEIQKSIRKLLNIIIFICVVVFVILFFAMIIIAKKMKKGFTTLNTKIIELSDGSGDLNKKIEITSGDEFEVIGDSINSFISELKYLVTQVAFSTSGSADGIKDINDNTISISANMQECSASTETVSLQLHTTSANIDGFAKNIDQMNIEMQQAFERAQEAAQLAKSHRIESEQYINELQNDIVHVMEQAKAVEQVKKINNDILSIVNETRILSMNAQIEAARAGEAGKGFVVVAKQVAKLSDDISSSVVNISEINDQVIDAMNQMVKYLDNMNNFLGKTVLEDYVSFAEIGQDYGDTTTTMQAHMQELKNQSTEIALTVNGVSNSIADISNAVSDSASQIERLCGSTVEITEGIDKLLEIPIINNAR